MTCGKLKLLTLLKTAFLGDITIVTVDIMFAVTGKKKSPVHNDSGAEVRWFVCLFRSSCGDVPNLSPCVLVDREGNNFTCTMYCKFLPQNVCHLGVEAQINMVSLSAAFRSDLLEFTLAYFFPLPQAFLSLEPTITVISPAHTNAYTNLILHR